MIIVIIIGYIILTSLGLILIKSGSNSITLEFIKGTFNCSLNWMFLLGLICYICSFILFTFVLIRKCNLTYVLPITAGISQVIVILAGLFIFKEYVNVFQIIGIVLSISGVVLLNIK